MAETLVELIRQGKDITEHLTDSEKERLETCEQIINKGLNTFLEVGEALAEIHDNRLYKATHKSFPKYCKDIWDLGKTTAQQKINGYRVVQLLKEKTAAIAAVSNTDQPESNEIVLRLNEAQTRPIAKLKNPDDQVKAWGIVLEKLNQDPKAKLTAALINKAVKEVQGSVVKKKTQEVRKAVETTALVSTIFKKQYQVLLDIVVEEQNNGWTSMKKTEVIKHLNGLIKIIESDE